MNTKLNYRHFDVLYALLKEHRQISAQYSILFIAGAIQDWQGTLHENESALIACSSESRKREFTAGRRMLRAAFHHIGVPLEFSRMDIGGCPILPIGSIGSITHTNSICIVAVGKEDKATSIGIDLELIGRVTREMWSILFTNEEINYLQTLCELEENIFSTVIYCAKESFIKLNYKLIGHVVDLRQIRVDILNYSCKNFVKFFVHLTEHSRHNDNYTAGFATFNDTYVFTHIVSEYIQMEKYI